MALFQSSVPCPYCYTSIDLNKVAFRCSGRNPPGRTPCTVGPDGQRQAHFLDDLPVLPTIRMSEASEVYLAKDEATCSDCGAQSYIRICPECHTVLPHGLDANSPLFGMVGVRDSGKTVLLSVLHTELTTTIGRRFDASIDATGGTTGLARSFALNRANMADGGTLPGQSDATGRNKKEPAVYEWRYTKKVVGFSRPASTILSFYDNAGEDVSSQAKALDQAYLAASSGIILMLDPFGFSGNVERAKSRGITLTTTTAEQALDAITFVLQTTHKNNRKNKVKQPLAVVISKIDAFFDDVPSDHPLRQPDSTAPGFDEAASRNVHDHVAALITQWGGDGLLRKLEQNYKTYRLFGVSALGAEPDYAQRRVSARGLLPVRVAEPALWLMATRGFIPKVG
jgi:hypothetical protein